MYLVSERVEGKCTSGLHLAPNMLQACLGYLLWFFLATRLLSTSNPCDVIKHMSVFCMCKWYLPSVSSVVVNFKSSQCTTFLVSHWFVFVSVSSDL